MDCTCHPLHLHTVQGGNLPYRVFIGEHQPGVHDALHVHEQPCRIHFDVLQSAATAKA
jgi:hypothetical protein